MSCTRYFLTPARALDPRPEPGRCERYWSLCSRRDAAAIDAHIEICPACRAWLAECDRISHLYSPLHPYTH